jgi:hypothetical protein
MSGGDTGIGRACMFCGAHAHRIGACAVCGRTVCERCGNVQHVRGEKRVTHNKCLAKDDGGFQMIKFVK